MQFRIVHEVTGEHGRLRVRAARGFSRRCGGEVFARLGEVPGIGGVEVNPRSGSVLLWYAHAEARAAALQVLDAAASGSLAPARRAVTSPPVLRSGCACGGFSLAAGLGRLARYLVVRPFLPPLARVFLLARSALPHVTAGLKSLCHGRLDVDVLDAAAIVTAFALRDFRTARTLVVLLGLGAMLEAWTRHRSRVSLAESLALHIDAVWVRCDGVERRIPLQDVREGDLVVARAGATIAVDGVVADGEALVNQSSMTGEPLAVVRSAGHSVYAGTVVEEGEIAIKVTGLGDGTRLQNILNFIEASQRLKASVESRALRLANVAVPLTFGLAGLVWLCTRDVRRAASVLLVDYSCALRLATPLAVLAALREGAQHGVLVKGGVHLENIARADTIVFDKTGTLTAARPVVAEVVPATGYTRTQILRLAACLEEHFPHPVARAVVRQAEREKLRHREEHSTVEYVLAHGIASYWRGQRVLLGSRHYVNDDENIPVDTLEADIARLTDAGKSLLYLGIDGKLAGVIAIEDAIRPESASVIAQLRAQGITRCVMLTGDDARTAAAVAEELGIDEFRAQILPVDKAEIVRELQRGGHTVLMVGDGMNDAPALSAADVGVSLRDGADLAREVADVVLVDGSLQGLVTVRALAKRLLRRIHTNFTINTGLNTAFLAGGLAGVLQPGLAALLHNSTTVGVTCNAMRPLLAQAPAANTTDNM